MGLDILELVIRTEEVFNITINNDDAEKIRTVGDLYELVCKLLNVSPTPDPDKLTGIHYPPSRYGPLSHQTRKTSGSISSSSSQTRTGGPHLTEPPRIGCPISRF